MTDHDYPPNCPTYPKLTGPVTKWRATANRAKGVKNLDVAERHAYGDAVAEAIRSLQRTEASRGLSAANPSPTGCASGTWHTTGDAIHKAVREQHKRALLACPAKERSKRTPDQWRAMYAEAMELKRQK